MQNTSKEFFFQMFAENEMRNWPEVNESLFYSGGMLIFKCKDSLIYLLLLTLDYNISDEGLHEEVM